MATTTRGRPRSAAAKTLEKDVDVTTDRDVRAGIERSSITGADRTTMGEANRAATSTDNKVDIGEAENTAASLTAKFAANQTIGELALAQFMRHTEELHGQRVSHAEELFTSRQRSRENAATFDKALDETYQAHSKSSNGQTIRNNDLGYDRLLNVDEQGYQVAQVLRDMGSMGVDNRLTYSLLLEAAAKALRETVAAEKA